MFLGVGEVTELREARHLLFLEYLTGTPDPFLCPKRSREFAAISVLLVDRKKSRFGVERLAQTELCVIDSC